MVQDRNAGLDVVRATAILLVLLAHGAPFIGPALQEAGLNPRTVAWVTGVYGVETFFCLSGFLIGSILFEIERRGATLAMVRAFLVRRWMRTLPLYFLTLGALAAIPHLERPHPDLLPFALMLQNFTTPIPGNWFGPSWSLTIEEWSYILIPAIGFLLLRSGSHRILAVAIGCCVVGLLARFWFGAGGAWDPEVRKLAVLRPDALAYGLIFAWIHERHGATLERLKVPLLASGAVLVVALCHFVSDHAALPGTFGRVLLLPLMSVGTLMMFPALMSLRLPGALARVVLFLSLISYALYLAHWPIMFLARGVDPAMAFAFYVGASVLTATILTFAVERPIMALRPPQFARGGDTGALLPSPAADAEAGAVASTR